MSNPLLIETLSPDAPICDRQKKIDFLQSCAESETNLVLFSRRYGKTALALRAQSMPAQRGCVTIRTLAAFPAGEMLSGKFTGRCGLPASSVQFARERLKAENLIRQEEPKGIWRVVDPVFSMLL